MSNISEMIAICSHARYCIEVHTLTLNVVSDTALKAELIAEITMWRQVHDLYTPRIKAMVTKLTVQERWEASHEC